jgi:hypothetical protein
MEIVFNSGDYATLLSEAERLGFTQDDAEGNPQIIVNGPMTSGGAYFLNVVGVIYEPSVDPETPPVPRAGYWGRLRANGDTADLPTFGSEIIQYAYVAGPDLETPGGWVNIADGSPAPDFIQTVGVIA